MVTIQIVTWNSADVLPDTLAALKQVPPSQAVIRFIDNHSTDATRRLIAVALPGADVVALPHNIGFAAAHNLGFAKCTTPFVLTCDPDVAIAWNGIVELLELFGDDEVAAAQGKLVRPQADAAARAVIDSAGIVRTFSLNGRERGAGELDLGQYNAPAIVDAVTGACGLYRLSALQKIAHHGTEIFDEEFFAYKEDVDAGWRLQRAGFVSKYEPVLAGIHRRTLGAGSKHNWGGNPVSFYRRLMNVRTHYSLRNYMWLLMKNISGGELIIHDIAIAGRLLVFAFFTIFYPPLLMAWLQALQGLPSMVRKRVA